MQVGKVDLIGVQVGVLDWCYNNNTYLPLHDIPFWKRQTKGNAMVTSAADFDDLQKWPPLEVAQ